MKEIDVAHIYKAFKCGSNDIKTLCSGYMESKRDCKSFGEGKDRSWERGFYINDIRQVTTVSGATCIECLKLHEKQKMKELKEVMDRINELKG